MAWTENLLVPTGNDDDQFRINFSLFNGIRVLLPKTKGHRKVEDGSPIRGRSTSPRKLSFVTSHHSGRNLNTATSKRRSSHRDYGSVGKERDGSRSSAEQESPRMDAGRMKARRLSLLVESLNIQQGQPPRTSPPRGSTFSRYMKNFHDVVNMAQVLGTDEEESIF